MKARITLKRVLEVISENVARRYGIFHEKASIEGGKDAYSVLLDPRKEVGCGGEKISLKRSNHTS